jgi:hypothetical protein
MKGEFVIIIIMNSTFIVLYHGVCSVWSVRRRVFYRLCTQECQESHSQCCVVWLLTDKKTVFFSFQIFYIKYIVSGIRCDEKP